MGIHLALVRCLFLQDFRWLGGTSIAEFPQTLAPFVAMPFVPSSVRSLLVVRPGAPSSFLLLGAMSGAPGSAPLNTLEHKNGPHAEDAGLTLTCRSLWRKCVDSSTASRADACCEHMFSPKAPLSIDAGSGCELPGRALESFPLEGFAEKACAPASHCADALVERSASSAWCSCTRYCGSHSTSGPTQSSWSRASWKRSRLDATRNTISYHWYTLKHTKRKLLFHYVPL